MGHSRRETGVGIFIEQGRRENEDDCVMFNGRSCFTLAMGLIAVVFTGGGCISAKHLGDRLTRHEFEQPHMGTLFKITLYAPSESTARAASDMAFAKVATLDRMMTDYDPESELMRLCRQPINLPVRVSEDLFVVLEESLRIARATDGVFDPTIGPVIRLWRRARRQEIIPTPEQIQHAQRSVGWQKLALDAKTRTVTLLSPDMQLDLGGIAKGYAADKALAVLRESGIARALVAASGDIAAGDAPPGTKGWRVSIGTPYPSGLLSKTFLLSNAAVSTSGDAEQFAVIGGQRYSHIVDPRTGLGLTNRLQVSVLARRAILSDVFATTVCLLGESKGVELINAQRDMAAIVVSNEGVGGELKVSRDKINVPGVKAE
jgi:thiamine biosynthesis lipoprotein